MTKRTTVQWRGIPLVTRGAVARLAVLFAALAALGVWAWSAMVRMPGRSHAGALPALSAREAQTRDALRGHVQMLAGQIGERNVPQSRALAAAASYVEEQLSAMGYFVQRQEYQLGSVTVANLEAVHTGTELPGESVVVGAHYDSVEGCPGANDNASGVAAMLELARGFAERPTRRTVRFVAFVDEEPPHFQSSTMGSVRYAQRLRAEGRDVVAMLSLETLGFYSDAPGSQEYPWPFGLLYPDRGDFVAFVGDVGSGALVRRAVGVFRGAARFPSEGGAFPSFVPGVGWSDQWAFWQSGYRGIMVTDTAPFRYREYHTAQDTPDKVDYARLARVTEGLAAVVAEFADGARP